MSIEKSLFAAADKMRGAMDAGEYKHIALGMLFLRYVSEAFRRVQKGLEAAGYDAEDRDEYLAENVFFVPEEARWSHLSAHAKDPKIGVMIDDAMRAIEEENESLKGALPKRFGREAIDRTMLTGLIDLFSNVKMEGDSRDFDMLGRVYEYCIGEFAAAEGKRGGEFFTPKSVVETLAEMIEPMRGRVYDPCCGTGGFFVQSKAFIEAHAGRKAHGTDEIAIYGQERNHTTFGLARMNLAIRGIFADLRWNAEGTLVRDEFPDERFDFILANPPFNISDWSGEALQEDARWTFGAPPPGNANFAWIQHIHSHLSATGVGGVVMANGSMSSMSGGEGEIRRAMVEGNAVDAIVALPGQLFAGSQIPVCLWILAKDKSNGVAMDAKLRDRRGEVLFIDARKMGALIPGSRKQKQLSSDEISRIADAYHAWRGEALAGAYADEPGFCKAATTEEIAKHNFVLTPGRYVGAGAAAEDDEPFEEKFERLTATLAEQFAEGRRLEAEIEARMRTLR
ncbi:type I restriction enzyme M protein [Fulvimarina manganoxydans]|uniref:site-specific DNA-methyltransferase (adenine-specific) n=1 Tax=Fulvimarina manganoxydans TaxID=937218 RepID=A0A1W2AQS6_9HYPH|nr:class I SAM-dependent DNA methyltransferase [Fulvimarina manganoxydans]SMC63066.1 type I restriction enzyme M protein [Fulvimarina manganoxydans]